MKRNIRIPSYIKYFFSYVIILVVMLAGSFSIVRKEIIDSYFEMRTDHVQTNLANIAEQMNKELAYLSRLNTVYGYDSVLKQCSYKEQLTDIETYKVNLELKKYLLYSPIITDIVYMSRTNEIPFAAQHAVAYKDGKFLVYQGARILLSFDPALYIGKQGGQLLFFQENGTDTLIYFPKLSSNSNEIWFFFLSTTNVMLMFQGMMSEEVVSTGMVSSEGEIISGINTWDMIPFLTEESLKPGISKTPAGEVMCVVDGIRQEYVLAAVLSKDLMTSNINNAFTSAYMALLLLGVAGLIIVLFSVSPRR